MKVLGKFDKDNRYTIAEKDGELFALYNLDSKGIYEKKFECKEFAPGLYGIGPEVKEDVEKKILYASEKQMKLTDKKGDVCFYEDEKGKMFLSLNDGKDIFPVKDGKQGYKQIKKVGEINIKYDLNGCYGFSLFDKEGHCVDDRFWTMKKAEDAAKFLSPKRYEVKAFVLDCKKIDTAIQRAKKELVKQELHENFGQEYVRAIKDKFKVGLSYSLEDKVNMAKVDSFDHWCSTYTPHRGTKQMVR